MYLVVSDVNRVARKKGGPRPHHLHSASGGSEIAASVHIVIPYMIYSALAEIYVRDRHYVRGLVHRSSGRSRSRTEIFPVSAGDAPQSVIGSGCLISEKNDISRLKKRSGKSLKSVVRGPRLVI